MRTAIKKLNVAIDTRDADAARQELKKVIPVVDKAATKGVIHKNNASRKISRLTSKVDSMAAPE
jgi:small subunit ribosomal protein S20